MEQNGRKVFGMAVEEIGRIKQDVLSWTDSNHPFVDTRNGEDGFRSVFIEGARMLKSNLAAAKVFAKIQK